MPENRLHNSKLSSIKKRDSVPATSDDNDLFTGYAGCGFTFLEHNDFSLKERIPEIVYIPNTVATSKT